MSMRKATDKQFLEVIDGYQRAFGYPPSIRSLCYIFGYSSSCTVQHRIQNLVDLGLLTKKKRHPRTLQLTELGLEKIGRM